MKKLLLTLLLAAASLVLNPSFNLASADAIVSRANGGDATLAQAFEQQRSDVPVEGQGVVVKTLPDDVRGSRHQRFILRLESGQTVLVAHNIDLAPKIASLNKGDTILFKGEYEWNHKGGVIHWTHHDPDRRHVDGWLKHKGATYQ